MEADEGHGIFALPLEAFADELDMPRRFVNASTILRHDGNVAIRRSRAGGAGAASTIMPRCTLSMPGRVGELASCAVACWRPGHA